MSIVSGICKPKKDDLKHKKSRLRPNPISQERTLLTKDRSLLAGIGYYVGRKIDSGTFATVRYAEKTSITGTMPLAVKIIDKAKASPLFIHKFLLRELDFWPKLRHRHIIQVENICPIDDRIYVFMELASKGSVIEYVQSHGAIEEEKARNWCRHLCQALRYCHKRGISHRDLKCDNLLLDKELQIKIGDFGFCCRSVDRLTGKAILSETYCGSSSYVAPEVIESNPYDPMIADVWSAGVCIYVILNNAMPFDDSNIRKMHDDQTNRKWVFSPEVSHKLTPAAKKLMTCMMEPIPSKRPTMDQVLNSSWMRMKLNFFKGSQ